MIESPIKQKSISADIGRRCHLALLDHRDVRQFVNPALAQVARAACPLWVTSGQTVPGHHLPDYEAKFLQANPE
jgi:hypothetical protein